MYKYSAVSLLLILLAAPPPRAWSAENVEGLLPIDEAYQLSADTSTRGVVKLHWEIAPNYYLYRGQMKFSADEGVVLGDVELPDGEKHRDEYLGAVETYRGSVDAGIAYTLAPGARRIKLSVRYQGCHELAPKLCYPPRNKKLDLPLPGAGGKAHAAANNSSAAMNPPFVASTSASPIATMASDAAIMAPEASDALTSGAGSGPLDVGLITALVLAFAGGLVLNLMPCVLPMLSIKAIGLLESGGDTGRARRHALLYTAGVLCTFAAIGLTILALRSLVGREFGWGAQLQQPFFVGVLVCVMVAVGLSMSGAVQFGTSLGNLGHSWASRSGWTGDFFTGVLAVAVASPCVAPFMGTALAYAFAAPMLAALLVFLALGLGLAAPFLAIGFAPETGLLLPSPGAWTETLKQVLAFPMYLTAVWLVWVLAHQRGADAVGLVLIAAVFLAMTLWWFERSRLRGASSRVLVVALASLTAVPLYALTRLSPAMAGATSEAGVAVYTPEKLAELRKAGTPVFVGMTADWCITCKVNEHVVLETQSFRNLLERTGAVYMKGDWTDVNPAIEAFLKQYHSPGVPLYVVFPKNGAPGTVLPSVLTTTIVEGALTGAAM